MQTAVVALGEEMQIVVDGAAQGGIESVAQHVAVHGIAVLEPEIVAEPGEIAHLGLVARARSAHGHAEQVGAGVDGQRGGVVAVARGHVLHQIGAAGGHGVGEHAAQLGVVGGIAGPVGELHIEIPPGGGPGRQHQPRAAVVGDGAALAGGRGQLVELRPVEILEFLVGKAHKALGIEVVPPGSVALIHGAEHGGVGCGYVGAGGLRGYGTLAGVGRRHHQCAVGPGAKDAPCRGIAAAGEQRLAAQAAVGRGLDGRGGV